MTWVLCLVAIAAACENVQASAISRVNQPIVACYNCDYKVTAGTPLDQECNGRCIGVGCMVSDTVDETGTHLIIKSCMSDLEEEARCYNQSRPDGSRVCICTTVCTTDLCNARTPIRTMCDQWLGTTTTKSPATTTITASPPIADCYRCSYQVKAGMPLDQDCYRTCTGVGCMVSDTVDETGTHLIIKSCMSDLKEEARCYNQSRPDGSRVCICTTVCTTDLCNARTPIHTMCDQWLGTTTTKSPATTTITASPPIADCYRCSYQVKAGMPLDQDCYRTCTGVGCMVSDTVDETGTHLIIKSCMSDLEEEARCYNQSRPDGSRVCICTTVCTTDLCNARTPIRTMCDQWLGTTTTKSPATTTITASPPIADCYRCSYQVKAGMPLDQDCYRTCTGVGCMVSDTVDETGTHLIIKSCMSDLEEEARCYNQSRPDGSRVCICTTVCTTDLCNARTPIHTMCDQWLGTTTTKSPATTTITASPPIADCYRCSYQVKAGMPLDQDCYRTCTGVGCMVSDTVDETGTHLIIKSCMSDLEEEARCYNQSRPEGSRVCICTTVCTTDLCNARTPIHTMCDQWLGTTTTKSPATTTITASPPIADCYRCSYQVKAGMPLDQDCYRTCTGVGCMVSDTVDETGTHLIIKSCMSDLEEEARCYNQSRPDGSRVCICTTVCTTDLCNARTPIRTMCDQWLGTTTTKSPATTTITASPPIADCYRCSYQVKAGMPLDQDCYRTCTGVGCMVSDTVDETGTHLIIKSCMSDLEEEARCYNQSRPDGSRVCICTTVCTTDLCNARTPIHTMCDQWLGTTTTKSPATTTITASPPIADCYRCSYQVKAGMPLDQDCYRTCTGVGCMVSDTVDETGTHLIIKSCMSDLEEEARCYNQSRPEGSRVCICTTVCTTDLCNARTPIHTMCDQWLGTTTTKSPATTTITASPPIADCYRCSYQVKAGMPLDQDCYRTCTGVGCMVSDTVDETGTHLIIKSCMSDLEEEARCYNQSRPEGSRVCICTTVCTTDLCNARTPIHTMCDQWLGTTTTKSPATTTITASPPIADCYRCSYQVKAGMPLDQDCYRTCTGVGCMVSDTVDETGTHLIIKSCMSDLEEEARCYNQSRPEGSRVCICTTVCTTDLCNARTPIRTMCDQWLGTTTTKSPATTTITASPPIADCYRCSYQVKAGMPLDQDCYRTCTDVGCMVSDTVDETGTHLIIKSCMSDLKEEARCYNQSRPDGSRVCICTTVCTTDLCNARTPIHTMCDQWLGTTTTKSPATTTITASPPIADCYRCSYQVKAGMPLDQDCYRTCTGVGCMVSDTVDETGTHLIIKSCMSDLEEEARCYNQSRPDGSRVCICTTVCTTDLCNARTPIHTMCDQWLGTTTTKSPATTTITASPPIADCYRCSYQVKAGMPLDQDCYRTCTGVGCMVSDTVDETGTHLIIKSCMSDLEEEARCYNQSRPEGSRVCICTTVCTTDLCNARTPIHTMCDQWLGTTTTKSPATTTITASPPIADCYRCSYQVKAGMPLDQDCYRTCTGVGCMVSDTVDETGTHLIIKSCMSDLKEEARCYNQSRPDGSRVCICTTVCTTDLCNARTPIHTMCDQWLGTTTTKSPATTTITASPPIADCYRCSYQVKAGMPLDQDCYRTCTGVGCMVSDTVDETGTHLIIKSCMSDLEEEARCYNQSRPEGSRVCICTTVCTTDLCNANAPTLTTCDQWLGITTTATTTIFTSTTVTATTLSAALSNSSDIVTTEPPIAECYRCSYEVKAGNSLDQGCVGKCTGIGCTVSDTVDETGAHLVVKSCSFDLEQQARCYNQFKPDGSRVCVCVCVSVCTHDLCNAITPIIATCGQWVQSTTTADLSWTSTADNRIQTSTTNINSTTSSALVNASGIGLLVFSVILAYISN